ncbi:kinesin-like protein KIF16B [Pollicipes pollicipes]|uniref:kinesin-like protein KIF16B n=1 Tax=Pollicipes pollicipes TaxID=41117 RepID=UPI0018855D8C|nr:kinesin-like protein KIF16B [Pollicipes pollicipes]
MSLSCVEVYNETVRDLLTRRPESLRAREHPQTGPYVQGLGMHLVSCAAELRSLLARGMSRRQVGATQLNGASSRSHALVTLSRRRLKEAACINRSLVALGNVISALGESSCPAPSGSERTGDGRRRRTFVSYRGSVLTWLLKDSLGGNSKTVMVSTVSPASTCYSDTLSTLRFADRARAIVNRPVVNEEPGSRVVMELRAEVNRLRSLLALNKVWRQ